MNRNITILFAFILVTNLNIDAQITAESLTLERCLQLADKNNNYIKIFQEDLRIAEARESQAYSALWPSLEMIASVTTLDEDPNFKIPNFPINLPAMEFGEISIPPLSLAIPEQIVKLQDKENIRADLNFKYPLYTGGKISSIINQAETGVGLSGIDIDEAKNLVRYQVKKTFYGALLAAHLVKVGEDALARLKVTLELTESLYLNGSGSVTRTDYLSNKFIVETAGSFLKSLENNKSSAFRALEFLTGEQIDENTELTEGNPGSDFSLISANTSSFGLEEVNYGFLKMNKVEDIFNYKIDEARSEYYPNLALIGFYSHTFNKYDYGFVTPENKSQWMIGVGLQFPIFNGFLTSNRVEEAERQLSKFQLQKEHYRQALILQADIVLSKLKSVSEELVLLESAFRTASENRELSERAYQNEMLEIEKLMQSQLLETYANINYAAKQYELNVLYSEFDYILCKK